MRQGGTVLMQPTHAVLFKQSPFQSKAGQDGLELALTLATFEQPVELFFKDLGIQQLLKGLTGEPAGRKTYTAAFKSLELYDIEAVYVYQPSLAQLNISLEQLAIEVIALTPAQWHQKLQAQDRVLSF